MLADYSISYSEQLSYQSVTAVTGMTYIPGGGFISSQNGIDIINSMYATRSGLIVFTNIREGDPVFRAAIPRPNDQRLANMFTVCNCGRGL